MSDCLFWNALDEVTATHELIIDRPKGSAHPQYPEDIYPLDYGYLQGTVANDGSGIDVWVGTLENKRVCAIIVTVDLYKHDSEIKILLSCTQDEQQIILAIHNQGLQSAILIQRNVSINGGDS